MSQFLLNRLEPLLDIKLVAHDLWVKFRPLQGLISKDIFVLSEYLNDFLSCLRIHGFAYTQRSTEFLVDDNFFVLLDWLRALVLFRILSDVGHLRVDLPFAFSFSSPLGLRPCFLGY